LAADDQSSPPESPRKRNARFLREFALVMELPFIPVAAVLIGGGIGYWLDTKLHTAPWLLLVFGFFGFVAGIRELLRRVRKDA